MKEHHHKHDGKSHHGKHVTQGQHPHHKMKAMPQFNEGHWQHDAGDVNVAGGRYAAELDGNESYKKNVDGLSSYVKSHRAEH